MVPKSSDKKIAAILKDTITLLCKNSIAFERKCTIEAVVGITVDDNNVILVSMSELVRVASSSHELAVEKKDSSDSQQSTREERDKQGKPCTDKPEDYELDLEISVTDSPGMGQEGMEDNEVLDLDISVTDSPGLPDTGLELSDEESKSSTDLLFVKQEVGDHGWTGLSGNNHHTELKKRSTKDPVQPAFVVQPISLQQQQQQQQQQQHWLAANYSPPTSQQPTTEANKNSSTDGNLKTVQKRPGRKRQKQQKQQQQEQEQEQKQQQQQQKRELLKGTKSKQFKCKHCQKCFAGKWYLEMHEKTHRGIYPFTCSVCSKGVLTSGHLRMHLDRHKRESKQSVDKTETAASSEPATGEQAFSPVIVDVVSQSLLDKM